MYKKLKSIFKDTGLKKIHINIFAVIGIIAIFLSIGLITFNTVSSVNISTRVELSRCQDLPSIDEQLDCTYRIIENNLHDTDTIVDNATRAMQIFTIAYGALDSFPRSCHEHAHRVGDLIYYKARNLNNVDDILNINFPQETTACDNGFIHGFIEHLIQDNPNPNFAQKTCASLTKNLSSNMADISGICHHASGHGFLFAQLEDVHKKEWGNTQAFINKPLAKCRGIASSTPSEIDRCMGGVFHTTIYEVIKNNTYGFPNTYEDLLTFCNTIESDVQRICYEYIISDIVDKVEDDPKNLVKTLESLQDEDIIDYLFESGIFVITTRSIAEKDTGYKKILGLCQSLNQHLYNVCLSGVVTSLYIAGPPQKEYLSALEICTEKTVVQRGERNFCYQKVAESLPKVYTPEKTALICQKFPIDVRGECEKIL